MEQLTEQVSRLVLAVDAQRIAIDRMNNRIDADLGYLDEMRFERKAPSLFGPWLRKPRVVTLNDLDLVDQAEDQGVLSQQEIIELRALDLIVEGRDRADPEQRPLLLAVEVSRTLEENDMSRALRRAQLLEEAGYRGAAVGCRTLDDRLRELAQALGVPVRQADDAA